MKKMPMGREGRGGGGPNLIKLHPSVPRPSLDPLIIWSCVMETRCCAQPSAHHTSDLQLYNCVNGSFRV